MATVDSIFPLRMVDCKTENILVDSDARIDYACTSSGSVRWPMTIMHLMVMGATLLVTAFIYHVYLRLENKRLRTKLRNMPLRTLPIGRDKVSYKVQVSMYHGFSRVSQDYSISELISGSGPPERSHFHSIMSILLDDSA